jgi:M6 family metalloprotease-like protein
MTRLPTWIAVLIALAQSSGPANAQKSAPCAVRLKPLVIQIEFPDIPRKIQSEFVRKRFLQDPDSYIREMSYGKACLEGELTKRWYRMLGPIKDYWVPWQNLKVDKQVLQRLVAHAVGPAERDVDITRYDFVIIVLAATALQWGNQGLNTYPGLLGIADDSSLVTPGGRKIRGGIAIFAQSANLGKIFHNMAHIMAGVKGGRRVLPDMYDQDLASESTEKSGPLAIGALVRAQMHMGAWDPMSCNQCLQRPGIPGVSSWTKLRLGWLDEKKLRTVSAGESTAIKVGSLSDAASSTLAIRIPLTPLTYYLVENRQPVGFDKNLPASGVLIMYGDDGIPEPRRGKGPVRLINADASVLNLDGAAFDVAKNSTFSDPDRDVKIQVMKKVGASYDVRVERKQ